MFCEIVLRLSGTEYHEELISLFRCIARAQVARRTGRVVKLIRVVLKLLVATAPETLHKHDISLAEIYTLASLSL
jgi:hypothetical protein